MAIFVDVLLNSEKGPISNFKAKLWRYFGINERVHT